MIKLGVVMDPIESIKIHKDSTFAMLLQAQARGWTLHYMELGDMYVQDGVAMARLCPLQVKDDKQDWFHKGETENLALAELDVILMRKDPPFDMEYIYATYLLELAETQGTLVVNRPSAIRDNNEKLSLARFPQCTTPTLVSRDMARMQSFLQQHNDIVLKPLDAMGGASIFRVKKEDVNRNVIMETLTAYGTRFAMAQKYIPEISQGDKRILMVNGEPVPYALARVPPQGELRGNLAAGGSGVGVELNERDYWICQQVSPYLKAQGLMFVGLDVIGDYLTEINVTSPTCIRELDSLYGLNIAGQLMDAIESTLAQS